MIRKGQAYGSAPGAKVGLLHRFIFRSVRGDELNCRSSIIYADLRLDYNLATLPLILSSGERSTTGDYGRVQGTLCGFESTSQTV